MTTPLENLVTTEIWSDNFDNGLSKWRSNDLVLRAQHRTGNKFLNPETGEIELNHPWHRVPGRWAGLYNDYRDECHSINEDGHLVLRGHAVKTPNPYRINFTGNDGVVHPYGDWMLYAAWLTSNYTIEPGSVLEIRVNLENMIMRAHRFNFWAMPLEGNAYDDDVSEVEIDFFEVENPSRVNNTTFGNKAMMKIVGGAAGDTPNGMVDLMELGIDLRLGWHVFSTVWNKDGSLDWYCDGILCQTDPRAVTMLGELILAREMNSGVKSSGNNSWENYSTGPKMPSDAGLTGNSIIIDVVDGLMERDFVLVDWVRVSRIEEGAPKEPADDENLNELIAGYEKVISDQKTLIDELSETLDKARQSVAQLINL